MKTLSISILCLLLASVLPVALKAQETAEKSEDPMPMPQGFSLGLAGAFREGLIVGEDSRQRMLPIISYEGSRFFFRGISGGVHLVERDGFQIDVIFAGRLDGWDTDDLDAHDLAAIGIDRNLLKDRDDGLDAGAVASWRGRGQRVSLELKGDVSNASGGYEASLQYARPFPLASGMLIPSIGVSYWSKDLADYYYGTLLQEEAAGLVPYRPGASLVANAGLRWMRPFAERWAVTVGFEYQQLEDRIVDSPLVDDDASGTASIFLGVSRRFGD
jgi:outer membrane protein